MRSLTAKQQDRVLELVIYLLGEGATQGIRTTHGEVSDALGWPAGLTHRMVRRVKEHPEIGLGITIRKGKTPLWIVSDKQHQLDGDAITEVDDVGRMGMLEGVWRLVRHFSAEQAQYNNAIDKRSAPARRHLNGIRHRRNLLTTLQAELDVADPRESDLADFIDVVLESMTARP